MRTIYNEIPTTVAQKNGRRELRFFRPFFRPLVVAVIPHTCFSLNNGLPTLCLELRFFVQVGPSFHALQGMGEIII